MGKTFNRIVDSGFNFDFFFNDFFFPITRSKLLVGIIGACYDLII